MAGMAAFSRPQHANDSHVRRRDRRCRCCRDPILSGRGRGRLRRVAKAVGMKGRIELAPERRRIVLGLMAEHLSQGSKVWVFGSRAAGRARGYSDLDLAIDAGRPLSVGERAIVAEAFEES